MLLSYCSHVVGVSQHYPSILLSSLLSSLRDATQCACSTPSPWWYRLARCPLAHAWWRTGGADTISRPCSSPPCRAPTPKAVTYIARHVIGMPANSRNKGSKCFEDVAQICGRPYPHRLLRERGVNPERLRRAGQHRRQCISQRPQAPFTSQRAGYS
jgi:hypothetical protein